MITGVDESSPPPYASGTAEEEPPRRGAISTGYNETRNRGLGHARGRGSGPCAANDFGQLGNRRARRPMIPRARTMPVCEAVARNDERRRRRSRPATARQGNGEQPGAGPHGRHRGQTIPAWRASRTSSRASSSPDVGRRRLRDPPEARRSATASPPAALFGARRLYASAERARSCSRWTYAACGITEAQRRGRLRARGARSDRRHLVLVDGKSSVRRPVGQLGEPADVGDEHSGLPSARAHGSRSRTFSPIVGEAEVDEHPRTPPSTTTNRSSGT